jgi:hypothetical protein
VIFILFLKINIVSYKMPHSKLLNLQVFEEK